MGMTSQKIFSKLGWPFSLKFVKIRQHFLDCSRQGDAKSHHASASAMPCFVCLLPLLIMFFAEIMCSVVIVVHSVDSTAVMMYKLVRCSVNVISQVSLLSQFAHTETECYCTALLHFDKQCESGLECRCIKMSHCCAERVCGSGRCNEVTQRHCPNRNTHQVILSHTIGIWMNMQI